MTGTVNKRLSRRISIVQTSSLDKFKQHLDNFDKLDFNIFEFKDKI